MITEYTNKGVCSRKTIVELNDDKTIKNIKIVGGCNGNTQGVARLVEGMKIDDVIDRLADIKCGFKNTSCPAQLAEALKEYKAAKGE